MCSKFGGDMGYCACIRPTGLLEGERMTCCSCHLSHSSTTCENSGLTSVCGRKKFQNNSTCADLPDVSAENIPTSKGHVFRRRKHYSPAVLFPTGVLENGLPNPESFGAHVSPVRSEKPSSAMEKHTDHGALHEVEGVRSSASVVICSDEPVCTHFGAFAEQPGPYLKGKGEKNVVLRSVDDSCSSSMINTDAGSASLKMEMDDIGECSSSNAFVGELMGDDMSEKDHCISILKSHGLLSCLLPSKSNTSEEDVVFCRGVGNSPLCGVCGLLGTTKNMLICDQCDEAFHVSCCNPNMRQTSFAEWFCRHCLKKKHKIMEEMNRRSTVIHNEPSSKPAISRAETSSIALMLEDSEPYTTGVRIGKDFQAVVPCWSGPITPGTDVVEEPTELDPPYINNFHDSSSEKVHKPKPISNWLQCQDVIVDAGDEGTICGKWRRAPIFEVQTDDWDCFSSVHWDPTHADCAVPQELETEDIMKQLKYIDMLKPRLGAKKRKSDAVAVNDSRTTIVLALRAPARRTG